jgi:DNA mismatch endonuclease (patch repair protein)
MLRSLGWTVLRYWEHVPPETAAGEILATLNHQHANPVEGAK